MNMQQEIAFKYSKQIVEPIATRRLENVLRQNIHEHVIPAYGAYLCFGWGQKDLNNLVIYSDNSRYPDIFKSSMHFMETMYPLFQWSKLCITVNRHFQLEQEQPEKSLLNRDILTCSFGDYTEGRFKVSFAPDYPLSTETVQIYDTNLKYRTLIFAYSPKCSYRSDPPLTGTKFDLWAIPNNTIPDYSDIDWFKHMEHQQLTNFKLNRSLSD